MKELTKQIQRSEGADRIDQERIRALEYETQRLHEKVAYLNAQLARLKKEYLKERIDPRTGLERERTYYATINDHLTQLIEDRRLDQMLEKDRLTESDLRYFNEIPFSITHADLAYLSKYNEDPLITTEYGEHGGGDEILRKTGELIQTIDPATQRIRRHLGRETRGYRIGGDEFALIHLLSKQDAQGVVVKLAHRQSEIEMRGSDLKPALNAGTAFFAEAVEVFYDAYTKEQRSQFSSQEKAKLLQRIITAIAERRAKLSKTIDRLDMMARLLRERSDVFDRNFQWLQKGAMGVSRSQFEKLALLLDGKRDEYMALVKRIAEQQLADDTEGYERRAVITVAERDF